MSDNVMEFEAVGTASYSPEDNKLRFYSFSRFGDELKQRIKSHGFKWAPKQECWVAPGWTPLREDLLIELCGEVGDEDYSPVERSADRAERFGGYREKRSDEAGEFADRFEAGPSAFGHQSAERAERQAARHDRLRGKAVNQWSKAEYWQERTESVIAHALFLADPQTRRGRILRLEKEYRDHLKTIESTVKGWGNLKKMISANDDERGKRWAENFSYYGSEYEHPRVSGLRGSLRELYKGENPITWQEAATLSLARFPVDGPAAEGFILDRWKKHYELRLAYENSMLEAEGGKASDIEMVPGGFIRIRGGIELQIQKVNKSNTTGRVVSVQVWGETSGYTKESGYTEYETRRTLVTRNIERLGEDVYRTPSAEELEKFQREQAEQKVEAKKAAPKKPSLINPTDEDAERLQELWNKRAADLYAEHCSYGKGYEPTQVRRMTQAEYSEKSKGAYSRFVAVNICTDGFQPKTHYYEEVKDESRPVVCKVRKTYGTGGGFSHQAYAVIILTDKPQKPLPFNWDEIETLKQESSEETA